jgi:CRISPR-associated protein Csm5
MSSKNTHILHIKTLSPVCIGDNKAANLFPYLDFVVNEREVHYIDKVKLMQSVEKAGGGALEAFVDGIERMDPQNPNRSGFDLAGFVKNYLEHQLSDFYIEGRKIQNRGYDVGAKREVTTVIKSAGRPYIPGSTIKGAIRTALLHDWIVNDKRCQRDMNNFWNIVSKNVHQILTIENIFQIHQKRRNNEKLSFIERSD